MQPHEYFDPAARGSGGADAPPVAAFGFTRPSMAGSKAMAAASKGGPGSKTANIGRPGRADPKAASGDKPPFFDENSALAFGAAGIFAAIIGLAAAFVMAPMAGLAFAAVSFVLLGFLFNYLKQ